jgi:dynein heavy chain
VAGVEGRAVAFLLSDSQVVDEAMLGDVNSLLNSGEVTGAWLRVHCVCASRLLLARVPYGWRLHMQAPAIACMLPRAALLLAAGLFTPEEQQHVLEQVHPWLATQPELHPGRVAAWQAFVSRARDHLHVVLAMSPVGEAFRRRCRRFPSLISCTTIDFFHPWPAEALLSVGTRALSSQPSLQQEQQQAQQHKHGASLVSRVAQLCVRMHQDLERAAERFHQELRRRCAWV